MVIKTLFEDILDGVRRELRAMLANRTVVLEIDGERYELLSRTDTDLDRLNAENARLKAELYDLKNAQ